MRQVVVCLFLIFASLLALPGLSLAQSPAEAQDEAKLFFAQMAESENPYIARMGRENLSRLTAGPEEASPQATRRVVVPLLTRNGTAGMAVPAMLNNRVMGTFLVDTGASYTVITPRIAEKIGVKIDPDAPKVRIMTANGTISAPKVTVPVVTIGGVEMHNVQVVVTPLGDDLLLSGLLGMSFFKNMEVSFRKDQLILTLPAEDPEKPLESADAHQR